MNFIARSTHSDPNYMGVDGVRLNNDRFNHRAPADFVGHFELDFNGVGSHEMSLFAYTLQQYQLLEKPVIPPEKLKLIYDLGDTYAVNKDTQVLYRLKPIAGAEPIWSSETGWCTCGRPGRWKKETVGRQSGFECSICSGEFGNNGRFLPDASQARAARNSAPKRQSTRLGWLTRVLFWTTALLLATPAIIVALVAIEAVLLNR
ncbi:MAG: hypothetical protein ACR2PG_23525 [Hyphomicrobiaceae bacterium]